VPAVNVRGSRRLGRLVTVTHCTNKTGTAKDFDCLHWVANNNMMQMGEEIPKRKMNSLSRKNRCLSTKKIK
jgi:hypothetical protein